MHNLRREARWLFVIGVIVVVALACAGYLLSNQRLASPLSDAYVVRAQFYVVRAQFANVGAVAPGLGAAVNVAGVKVGQISGVKLEDGRGVLDLRIEPSELPRVHQGATAALVPNTPLKDMQVDLTPGDPTAPALPDRGTIPVRSTATPVDSDELLHALDTDVREYLRLLLADLGVGLRGHGPELRGLLRALGPTSGQVRRIGALLASRRRELPRLVHNLSVLAQAAGAEDASIERVVGAGNATLAAVASQDGALRDALRQLPGTLHSARGTLAAAAPFARSLRRTLTALEPAVPRLRRTLADAPDTLRGLLPLPVPELRRFTTAVAPLGAQVRPTARDLGAALDPLTRAFEVIGATTNILGYDPGGGRKGYLFWLAWFAHNANSMLSTQDAHGAVWRGMALFSCASFEQPGPLGALAGALLDPGSACP
jgi:phospholipid/cholesterol/gamma-HCH transport system substrate-binding protein